MKIRFSGTTPVTKKMQRSANGAQSGAVKASRKLMKDIFTESQRLVPVETTSLKLSGRVAERLRDSTFTITIHYGGKTGALRDSSKYAVYVHEDLNKKHASPTQAKFVEAPFRAHYYSGHAIEVFKMYVGRELETSLI